MVYFLLFFGIGEYCFFGIYYDDEVVVVYVMSVGWFVFVCKDVCDLC